MKQEVDYAAFEFGLARPRLRADLKYTLQHGNGCCDVACEDRWYVIEDEANGKFYRIGHAEYTFLSLLDGETTIQSAIAETAAELGASALSESEAATLCRWLIESGLAEKRRHDEERWSEHQRKRKLVQRCRWVNPIMLKIPIGNPDSVVNTVTGVFGWIVSWRIASAMCILWAVSLAMLLPRVGDILHPTSPILAASNWFWLGGCWGLLRIVHEMAHAVTCKRYGGSVREWGILLLMFIPLPYVDVTSAWRFPRRGSRILTSAAGMLAELSVAAVAVIVWCNAESEFVKQHALNVMMAASFTTVLFNANPLMRFDGYHIIADALNVPNLWTHGRAFVRTFARRMFFSLPTAEPTCRPSHKWFIKLYGVASLVWTIMICVSLSLGALSLFDGVGLLLAAVAITLWIGVPAMRLGRFLLRGTDLEQPSRSRFAIASIVTVASCLALGWVLPAPSIVNAPLTIQHDPLTTVRATSVGFITDFKVDPGTRVEVGDVICRMENVELEAELRDVSLRLAASQQRVRAFTSAGEPAAAQRELEATTDLERKRAELMRRVEGLTVVAPVSGTILTDDLADRVGIYVKRGAEIVSIGGDGPRTAIALVSQSDADLFSELSDREVTIRVWGTFGESHSGFIRRINPRAQTSLPHLAFAAPVGGPLAVTENRSNDATNLADGSRNEQADWQLVDPRVRVEIELVEGESTVLRTGQTGISHIHARECRLGSYVYSGVVRYFRERIHRTHGI